TSPRWSGRRSRSRAAPAAGRSRARRRTGRRWRSGRAWSVADGLPGGSVIEAGRFVATETSLARRVAAEVAQAEEARQGAVAHHVVGHVGGAGAMARLAADAGETTAGGRAVAGRVAGETAGVALPRAEDRRRRRAGVRGPLPTREGGGVAGPARSCADVV